MYKMRFKHIHIKRFFRLLKDSWIRRHCIFLVNYFYGDIWHLREVCQQTQKPLFIQLYYAYMDYYGASIDYEAKMVDVPTFPHGILGVFISRYAEMGRDCVIFQHVTIGSNTLKDSGLRMGGVKLEMES